MLCYVLRNFVASRPEERIARISLSCCILSEAAHVFSGCDAFNEISLSKQRNLNLL